MGAVVAPGEAATFTGLNGYPNSFVNISDSIYWSLSTYATDTDNAWDVNFANFGGGNGSVNAKTGSYYVRCVRAGQAFAPLYLRDSEKQVVLDTSSGLMWQDDSEANTTAVNWSDAIDYCENNVSLGGYTDWRLPNYNELYQLADRGRSNPAISPVFQNTASSFYWSSSTYAPSTAHAWGVVFSYGSGYDDAGYKTNSNYVRCARAGQ